MATIKLTITVEKLSNVLSLFDVMKVYRSTTGEVGPYSEVTGVGTRIPLSSGKTVYTYDDTNGDPSYFYKTSYFNEGSTLESSLSDPIRGDANSLYLDVDAIRKEGVSVTDADDARVLELISTWQEFAERVTGNFFVPRSMTWLLDGSGSALLQLPVPIVSIEALYLNGDFSTALSSDEFVAYAGRGESGRDDRKNPRIKIKTQRAAIFSGVGGVRRRGAVFEVGEQNQKVVGVFGYLDAAGETPDPIVYAIKKLVVRSVTPLAGAGSWGTPGGPLLEEETDKHRRKWADPYVGAKRHSSTGDPEIDQIFAAYRAPWAMGAPRTGFGRFGRRS